MYSIYKEDTEERGASFEQCITLLYNSSFWSNFLAAWLGWIEWEVKKNVMEKWGSSRILFPFIYHLDSFSIFFFLPSIHPSILLLTRYDRKIQNYDFISVFLWKRRKRGSLSLFLSLCPQEKIPQLCEQWQEAVSEWMNTFSSPYSSISVYLTSMYVQTPLYYFHHLLFTFTLIHSSGKKSILFLYLFSSLSLSVYV